MPINPVFGKQRSKDYKIFLSSLGYPVKPWDIVSKEPAGKERGVKSDKLDPSLSVLCLHMHMVRHTNMSTHEKWHWKRKGIFRREERPACLCLKYPALNSGRLCATSETWPWRVTAECSSGFHTQANICSYPFFTQAAVLKRQQSRVAALSSPWPGNRATLSVFLLTLVTQKDQEWGGSLSTLRWRDGPAPVTSLWRWGFCWLSLRNPGQ